jgi:hypothetical protein
MEHAVAGAPVQCPVPQWQCTLRRPAAVTTWPRTIEIAQVAYPILSWCVLLGKRMCARSSHAELSVVLLLLVPGT